MKKAARIQVCTIVRSNAKKNISRRAKSKKKNQQNNDQTTRQTYKGGCSTIGSTAGFAGIGYLLCAALFLPASPA